MNIENKKLNILVISNINPNKGIGPYYSIRNQTYYLSKTQNVIWYNLNETSDEYWEETGIYYNALKFPNKTIKDLKEPFNKPDFIIFQGIYEYKFGKIIKEAIKFKIPYIIVPRSSLTKGAQNQKRIKKIIANKFIYNKLIRKASAIQYLTNEEKEQSGNKWNKNSFVMPNGIISKTKVTRNYNKESVKGLFIGRLDMNHKGLDLLITSVKNNKKILLENNYEIHLYGPEAKNTPIKLIKELIKEDKLEKIIKIYGPIYEEEKYKKLKEYDFFIMTSRFEGHPMGLIEALSFSLPVFITRGTNMYEEVKTYDAGWVCENNIESITKQIKVMISQKKEFKNKSENAYKLSKIYTWEDLTIETDSVIRKIKRGNKWYFILVCF